MEGVEERKKSGQIDEIDEKYEEQNPKR